MGGQFGAGNSHYGFREKRGLPQESWENFLVVHWQLNFAL